MCQSRGVSGRRSSTWLCTAILLSCLTSCSAESPTTPGVEASFVDDFERADTDFGLGDGWDLRGPYVDGFPLPRATDGFIRDGSYTYAGNDVVYAVRQLRGTVRSVGTVGCWRPVRGGGETTMTMAITANDKVVSDMVHFSVNRGTWELTVRRGQGFEPVASGVFRPALELNVDYQFELSASNDAVSVKIPGDEVTTAVDTAGVLGDRAFWEEYSGEMPAGVVFDFHTVWAVEEGQHVSGGSG